MNRIITYIKFLFRKRLSISSNIIHSNFNDFEFIGNVKDVLQYNEAVKNERYSFFENSIHPLFYTKISWKIIENLNSLLEDKIDEKILNTIVHLSEHFRYFKDFLPPGKIVVKSKIWHIAPHHKGTKMLLKFEFYSDNELFAIEYSGGLMYGVKCLGGEKSHGDIPKTKIMTYDPVWQKSIDIKKELPYIYAKKAKIDAPIHTDPEFARSIGLPNNILQGTCTLAKTIELILHKEFNKNEIEIKSVSAKFTGMVVLPNQIVVRLQKKEKDVFYFDVVNKEKETVIKGGQIKFNLKRK